MAPSVLLVLSLPPTFLPLSIKRTEWPALVNLLPHNNPETPAPIITIFFLVIFQLFIGAFLASFI